MPTQKEIQYQKFILMCQDAASENVVGWFLDSFPHYENTLILRGGFADWNSRNRGVHFTWGGKDFVAIREYNGWKLLYRDREEFIEDYSGDIEKSLVAITAHRQSGILWRIFGLLGIGGKII